MKQAFIIFIILCCLFFCACTSKIEKQLRSQIIEAPQSQAEIDKNLILRHAIQHKLELQSTESGIYYQILKKGEEGRAPGLSDIITAHYHGHYMEGKVFDSSKDRGKPLEFKLDRVIKGWQEAIPLLRKGGKGTFFIPSELAYGKKGYGTMIDPNKILVFDIELIEYYDQSEAGTRQARIDQKKITKYLEASHLQMQSTESGIYYRIEEPGSGERHPGPDDHVKAHYKGTLLDGTVFDSSYDRGKPLEFKLSGVIKGWREAIALLKKGGKGTFIIPSELAYGPKGAGGAIPPNSVLIFEIALLDF